MATKSITSGQMREIQGFVAQVVEDIIQEIGVNREGAQKLIGDAGSFKEEIKPFIWVAIRRFSHINHFVAQEVPSLDTYGSGYKGPKPIAEQVGILRAFFPHLGTFDETIEARPVPVNMEGYFAIPHWSLIASTYKEAVLKIMAAIAAERTIWNGCEEQLDQQCLCETSRKTNAFKMLREEQKGHDILVVAGQFGLRHRGRSVLRAREVFMDDEFGFGAYETAIMLLTHPERLVTPNDLWIDCAGDEITPVAGGDFLWCPFWNSAHGELRFSIVENDGAHALFGSASGVLKLLNIRLIIFS